MSQRSRQFLKDRNIRTDEYVEKRKDGPTKPVFVEDLLEEFHKEAMPTDEEMVTVYTANWAFIDGVKEGVRFCRNFVREPAKDVTDSHNGGKTRWTEEQFFQMLNKDEKDCDGSEIHLRHCWNENNFKSIFRITGLEFSNNSFKRAAYEMWFGKKKDRYLVVVTLAKQSNLPDKYTYPTFLRFVHAENEINATDIIRDTDEFVNSNIISASAVKL